MQVFLKYLFVATVIFFLGNRLCAQEKETPFEIFESLNDSIDLASDFYSFTDSLAELFFSNTEYYDNWSNEEFRYKPSDTAAFNRIINKGDSVILILANPHIGKYFVPPFCSRVTSPFGPRRGHFHYGSDIDLNTGDTVRCAFDGRVRITKLHYGYGKVMVIRHENGLESVYGHLSKFLVDSNEFVKAGQPVALGGNTGRSYGAHLHWELRFLGQPFNPAKVVDFDHFKLKSDTLVVNKKTFGYYQDIQNLKNARYHTVKSGETLGLIARKYGTTVNNLCRLNGIRSTTILRIGQKLRVR